MKLIISIVGARPQFIKASVISHSFKKIRQKGVDIKEIIIHTGQHYDNTMSSIFFKELNIPKPKYNLNIGGGTHGSNTGNMIIQIEKILIEEEPQGVVVYGDTDSTLAGCIAASKLNIPIFHIESGLRSFNRRMPEENNRIIADHLSEICFTPNEKSFNQLIKEGINKDRIIISGDVMVDAAKYYMNKADKLDKDKLLKKINTKETNLILATIHRKENTDNKVRLKTILESLNEIASREIKNQKYKIILPMHPRTQSRIEKYGLLALLNGINICEPLSYLEMTFLEKNSNLIITDSGGVQKEAYIHQTRCVTIRTETEWKELLENGSNLLANPDSKKDIIEKVSLQLNSFKTNYKKNIYGNGCSCNQIIKKIVEYIDEKQIINKENTN